MLPLDGIKPGAGTDAPPIAPDPARPRPETSHDVHFERIWRRLAREIDRGDATVSGAAHAPVAQMDAGTLIALQAGIYRYSEAIDLTVKLVDRASTAVRTVLESGR